MTRTEFRGVSADPDRGVDSRTGLYEFWTDRGEHVSLHEVDLASLTYEPSHPPAMTLVFTPIDTPAGAPSPPLHDLLDSAVEFVFRDVRVILWEEDAEAVELMRSNPEAASAAGQMRDFAWDGETVFTLASFTLTLTFAADVVEVRAIQQG